MTHRAQKVYIQLLENDQAPALGQALDQAVEEELDAFIDLPIAAGGAKED